MEGSSVEQGGVIVELHLLYDSESSCTKSVGTDLSMQEIGNLQSEVRKLRNIITSLQENLKEQAVELSKEVGPGLCSACKATLNHTEVPNHSELNQNSQQDVEEDISSVDFVCKNQVDSELDATLDFVNDHSNQKTLLDVEEKLEDDGGRLQCYIDPTKPDPTKPATTEWVEPMMCSVRLVNCGMVPKLVGHLTAEQEPVGSSGDASNPDDPGFILSGDYDWSPSCEGRGRKKHDHTIQWIQSCRENTGPLDGTQVKEVYPSGKTKLFPCSLCTKLFGNLQNLRKHEKRHQEEKDYLCEVCSRRFITLSERKRHMLTHMEEGKFRCSKCEKSFHDLSLFKIHCCILPLLVAKSCDDEWPHSHEGHRQKKEDYDEQQNQSCGESTGPSDGLQVENVSPSREMTPFPCSLCKKVFGNLKNLRKHEKRHKEEKDFLCEVCSRGFVSLSELKKHMLTHTGKGKFRCSICEKSFLNLSSFKIHSSTHSDERPFSCDKCEKSYKTKGALVVHQMSHTRVRRFPCSYCNMAFTHRAYLKKHEVRHTKEMRFQCSHCEKKFLRQDTLKAHERIHTEDKPYQCSHCGKGFRQRAQLKCHERTHTGEKPYLCAACGKRFSDPTHYNEHKRLHTGERPYCCTTCGKSFIQKIHLRHHITIHTGEKPYKCSQCEKTFARPCVFKNHQRIHTGEKPYQCPICKEKFAFLSSLNSHKKKHAADIPLVTAVRDPLQVKPVPK